MEKEKIIELDKNYIAQFYGRMDLAPVSGKNATVMNADGREYINFTSGIGVNSLGIADEGWIAAVTNQLGKIQHISNYYYSEPTGLLAEKLVKASGMKRAFFCNSGAEANEGAIKTARKYSFDKYGEGRNRIICLVNSFHGRTLTTLAATGQDVFHQFFFPFTEGFDFVEINNIDALKNAINNNTCAIMCEPIQGESGVNPLTAEYAEAIKQLCEEKDLLLIFDEVQTGIGRTGEVFAFRRLGITPDICSLAKGLGGGLPIGAVLLGERCENTLAPGQHGTTFGGNPVVAAGANEVMDRITEPRFLESVRMKGDCIRSAVSSWDFDNVVDVRGAGLMIGVQVKYSHKEVAKKCLEKGLMILTAGKDVVRMLPPLTFTYGEIDRGLEILHDVLAGMEN
ncbi:MAG: aspartate aminotransferase family protein [Clostridia bacterium]|nr:aspartate aminotransferase family protein [Clostridia bacterium]